MFIYKLSEPKSKYVTYLESCFGQMMSIFCIVSYQVIAASYVRSVGCVFALFYTFVYNSEHPWNMN